ncbi:hypothetical protein [Streptomyces griseorubiginosus]|uniref:hypothetical protein n=1 Tax=Streptomyces griseorubiginosus TaxID=67304 RepID=UPI0036E29530
MSDDFSFADCEAVFGPENEERVDRSVAEAPRFSPEQILRGQRLFASFGVPRPADPAADAEGGAA